MDLEKEGVEVSVTYARPMNGPYVPGLQAYFESWQQSKGQVLLWDYNKADCKVRFQSSTEEIQSIGVSPSLCVGYDVRQATSHQMGMHYEYHVLHIPATSVEVAIMHVMYSFDGSIGRLLIARMAEFFRPTPSQLAAIRNI